VPKTRKLEKERKNKESHKLRRKIDLIMLNSSDQKIGKCRFFDLAWFLFVFFSSLIPFFTDFQGHMVDRKKADKNSKKKKMTFFI